MVHGDGEMAAKEVMMPLFHGFGDGKEFTNIDGSGLHASTYLLAEKRDGVFALEEDSANSSAGSISFDYKVDGKCREWQALGLK